MCSHVISGSFDSEGTCNGSPKDDVCSFFGNNGATAYIVIVNICVIGTLAMWAVLRFAGVLLCILACITSKAHSFAHNTSLKPSGDALNWHQQYVYLQRRIQEVRALHSTPAQ